MHNKNLFRIIFIVSISVISVSNANAQKSAVIEERDEYGMPTIICGPGWSVREYSSGSGEKIVSTERLYESPELVDEAIEESQISREDY